MSDGLALPMVVPEPGLPEQVTIYEVGPRDGLQNERAVVPVEVKAEFIGRLAAAGLRTDEATSFVRPEWVPQLADAADLLTLLGVAGCSYIMGIPGADDIMLAYQSTSFHDALYLRQVLGLKPAPEFEAWLDRMGIFNGRNSLADDRAATPLLSHFSGLSGA